MLLLGRLPIARLVGERPKQKQMARHIRFYSPFIIIINNVDSMRSANVCMFAYLVVCLMAGNCPLYLSLIAIQICASGQSWALW